MLLGGYSKTGPRETNEDSYFAQSLPYEGSIANGVDTFLMVSDGMGGYRGGDVASGMVVRSAEHYLANVLKMAMDNRILFDPALALEEIVRNAHDAVVLEAQARGNANMGATFVGVFMSASHAWVGHVGDSRAYLWRDGELVRLTEDHSKVGRLLNQGMISEGEAQAHPDRHRIERAIGFSNHEVEITEVALRAGDGMVLCTDGVYTTLDAREMAACVSRRGDADAIARAIVNQALSNGSDDNATAVVAKDDTLRTGGGSVSAQTQRLTPVAPSMLAGGERVSRGHARRAPATERMAQADRERGGAQRATRGNAGGRSGRKEIVLVACSVIVAFVTVVVLVVCKLMVPVDASDGRGDGRAASAAAVSDASGVDDPESDGRANQEASPHGKMPGDAEEDEDVTQMGEYWVGGGAVLRSVDASGVAYRFQDDPNVSFDVSIEEGSVVVASVHTKHFGRENRAYRQLSDDYLQGLLRDVERHAQGSDAYTSSLSAMVGRDAYADLMEALAGMDSGQVRETIAHLALCDEDLTAVE